ncbi:MAG: rhomboid family intramembrane serine protease [Rubrivivax sp.]|nr:MAG: rhomboid family intramembrane serine protease [Rubrivivax sp.]
MTDPLDPFSSPGAAGLLAAFGIASLAGLFAMPELINRGLLRPYWLVRRHQYLTLVTSGFLHADLPHLLFNAFTFWAFAPPLERAMGTGPFLGLYVFGLLVSGLATWFKHRHDPGYQCLGASGAILAVLFASIVHFPSSSIFIMPLPFPIPAPLFAVAYLAYSYYASRQAKDKVNHDAHLTGAVAGLVFVGLLEPEALAHAWHAFTR